MRRWLCGYLYGFAHGQVFAYALMFTAGRYGDQKRRRRQAAAVIITERNDT